MEQFFVVETSAKAACAEVSISAEETVVVGTIVRPRVGRGCRSEQKGEQERLHVESSHVVLLKSRKSLE